MFAYASVATVLLLLVLLAPGVQGAPPPASSIHPSLVSFKNVSYNSSVDGFPLSYAEWLPLGYSSLKATPLIVYLHGLEGNSNATVRGGVESDLTVALTGGRASS